MALRLHPLPLFFLTDFCRRNDWSLDWLLDCMDPDGKESIPQGTAAEIELMSKGEVPVSCWPRLKKVMLGGPESGLREGRPPRDPNHPVYVFLKENGGTLSALGAVWFKPKLDHQRITHYVMGRRATPMSIARIFQKKSNKAIPWTCWPLVHDETKGVYYHFGKAVEGRELLGIRKNLKRPVR